MHLEIVFFYIFTEYFVDENLYFSFRYRELKGISHEVHFAQKHFFRIEFP